MQMELEFQIINRVVMVSFLCFTLGKYRREGRGPKHMRIGRLVRYLRADVLTWRDAQQEG